MPYKEITLRSTKVMLPKGAYETAALSWSAEGASSVTIATPEQTLRVNLNGQYEVSPAKTSIYILKAVFPDGSSQTKSIQIEVVDKARLSYDVEEKLEGKNVFAEFRWNVENASSVSLDGERVASSGYKTYLVNGSVTLPISYDDPFGTHKTTIRISDTYKSAWLLTHFFKLLVRPFTFVGYVGKKEMRWTNLICFLAVAVTVAVFIANNIQYYYSSYSLCNMFNYGRFYPVCTVLSLIMYIWIMQLGKRFKSVDASPWYSMFFFPLFVYPWVVAEVNIDTDFHEVSVISYAIYFVLFLIVAFYSRKTSHKKRYQRIKVW